MRHFFSSKFASLLFSVFILVLSISTVIHYQNLTLKHFYVHAQDGGDSGGGDSGGGDSGGGDSGGDAGSDSGGDQSGGDSGGDQAGDAGGDQSGGEAGDAGGSEGDAGSEAGDATSEGDPGTESPGDDGGDGQEESPSSDPEAGPPSEEQTGDSGFEQQGPGDAGFDLGPGGNLVTTGDPAGLSWTDANGDLQQGPVGSLPPDVFNDLTGGNPEATGVHTSEGWFTCDCSPQTDDPGTSGPTDTISGGDVGGDNTGNSGGGGGDNPDNTGPPPCAVNCSPAPPTAFTQNLPEVLSCQATNNNPVIKTSWTSSSNLTRYIMYYLDSADQGNPIRLDRDSTEGYNFDSSKLIPGHSYSFVIIAVNNQNFQTGSDADSAHPNGRWSHDKFNGFTTFPDCSPPPPLKPVISLWFNNDLPQWQVRQNAAAVTLDWRVESATSCTASSDPVKSYWTGGPNSVVNPVTSPTGSYQPLDTQTIGSFKYILTCTNTNSSGLSSSDQATAILTVTQLRKPYIETTGGDVHTNEFINIPE